MSEVKEEHIIRHDNGNSIDNRLTNLDWGTRKQNTEDRIKHGRVLTGEKHPCSKLTEHEVRIIKTAKGTHEALAAKFGVSQSVITEIKNGKAWKWLR